MISWLTWPWRMLAFLAWFAKEVVVANVAVLRDNLTPGQDSVPGITRFATRCRTDTEITTLAAIITLTPGTLTMGTEEVWVDGRHIRVLFVHSMYTDTPDMVRADLADMETHMLKALRREGEPR
ncbi:Na+/H+ antiporter subunit E [Mycobacterium sp. smrl_JER01]|uniref:Na+/H+ antiporter subunit E n=1 Tax=Mycobacterium sp. smrl_JER01 TaxID=3402633 RepID=UPI003ACAECED